MTLAGHQSLKKEPEARLRARARAVERVAARIMEQEETEGRSANPSEPSLWLARPSITWHLAEKA